MKKAYKNIQTEKSNEEEILKRLWIPNEKIETI